MAETRASMVRQLRRPASKINRRWSTNWLATLVTSTGEFLCIIEDISEGGAKLRVGSLPAEDSAQLVIGSYEPIAGLVAWRSGDRVGLTFKERQPLVEELLRKAAKQVVSSVTAAAKTRPGKLTEL